MSPLNRLIARSVKRLPSRRGPKLRAVRVDGLLVADQAGVRLHGWNEVDCVVAASGAGLVGETMLLAMELADGTTLTVPETDAHWPALVEEIPIRLVGAEPEPRWRLRLLAEPSNALEIYRRP